ncbi:MAG: cytochrome ubiquinol oxidase subunit I [Candidatus Promineifilaceae bacterium]|nr:cytochrome ubiquinol oxidase subunit I [Candidatus Promineifilaceae bacterium]
MDPELLSRLQFALTASFHFIFPPISMGLGLLLVFIGIIYVRTGDPKWRQISFFWVKVYGLVFAMGIATGIVQEFEFGMNWANYSRFVGNIFGSLLAAEGIFAFFLEGGFLGLMLFGGNRLGPRMWLLSTFLVVFGAHFSALWILMANSWMQTPAGYMLQDSAIGQQAVMTSFAEVVFTPTFIPRLLHVWVASWMVGSSLMLSVSAWYLLKSRHVELSKSAFKVALPVFVILSFLQAILFGANQAIEVTNYQPVKLAAMEGVWESQSCAPMFIVGWVNESEMTTKGISIPCLLSFLAYQDINATVTGLEAFPSDVWAPINLTFQVYHLMINLGGMFVLIGLLGAIFFFWKRRIFRTRWLLWVFVFSIVLTELATLAGWWTAEFGRQPWIVWNLLRTADAVSPTLTGSQVAFSVGTFVVLYTILFILFIYLMNEKIQHGPEELGDVEAVPVDALPDSFREIFRREPRA